MRIRAIEPIEKQSRPQLQTPKLPALERLLCGGLSTRSSLLVSEKTAWQQVFKLVSRYNLLFLAILAAPITQNTTVFDRTNQQKSPSSNTFYDPISRSCFSSRSAIKNPHDHEGGTAKKDTKSPLKDPLCDFFSSCCLSWKFAAQFIVASYTCSESAAVKYPISVRATAVKFSTLPHLQEQPSYKTFNFELIIVKNRYHQSYFIKPQPLTPHQAAQQGVDHQPEFRPSSSHYYPRTATSNPPHAPESPTKAS
jgi:hypothetical protein